MKNFIEIPSKKIIFVIACILSIMAIMDRDSSCSLTRLPASVYPPDEFEIFPENIHVDDMMMFDHGADKHDGLLVDHLKSAPLAGGIFGPRWGRGFTVKFNTMLEKEKGENDFHLTSHCRIQGDEDITKIKMKTYGIIDFTLSNWKINASGRLYMNLRNIYIRPREVSISIGGVLKETPLLRVEELCDGIFSFIN